ncbi:MAG: monothiol bacilliredoxin BrxC family protein [Trueperaceae bacterium]
MFKDRVINLTTPDEVTEFLAAHPTSVVFKAGTCHKTMQGFGFVQEKLEPREDLHVGLIRVVEARAASNLVAESTAIRHESPQVILFRDGEAVFDLDNWSITPEALAEGFERLPGVEAAPAVDPRAASDLAPYIKLLEGYLSGVMDERQFEQAYTTTFRDDASLRSREEVEVLNSIFGDVDKHMNMHLMMAGKSDTSKIRERAERAHQQLTSPA